VIVCYISSSNNNDAETLQKDLDKLGHWENEWCMKFHSDKCTLVTVFRVTNKKKTIDAKYQLHKVLTGPFLSAGRRPLSSFSSSISISSPVVRLDS
jgi:hypothetical protein